MKVSEIDTSAGFFELRSAWDATLAESRSDNVFLSWDWLYSWWSHYGEGKELLILVFEDGSGLKGIAPFYRTRHRSRVTDEIRFLGSPGVGSDYLDFIIRDGYEQVVLENVLNHVFRRSGRTGIMRLSDLPAQSANARILKDLAGLRFRVREMDHTVCPYIKLPATYEDFMTSLSYNMRYNVNRKRRKFEKELKGEFFVLREPTEFDFLVGEMIRLNVMRMNEKNIVSPFKEERFAAFHRDVMKMYFDRGQLRLCFLKVKDALIGCLYIFSHGGRYSYYQCGFDTSWDKYSPGIVLFSYCIEKAIHEGMNEFDFLQGDEQYKHNWTKDSRNNIRMDIYNSDWPGNLVYCCDTLGEWGKGFVRSRLK